MTSTSGAAFDLAQALIDGLEAGEYVPGQRMIEADISRRYNTGRQIVRDALQRLNALGIVELAPNRGARIVSMTAEDAILTLDVTEVMFGLLARSAARRIAQGAESAVLASAIANLTASQEWMPPHVFAKARRQFFAALTQIAGNQELSRVIEQLRVHVLRAQFGFASLGQRHARELAEVGRQVMAGDEVRAEQASRAHVSDIREYLTESQKCEQSDAI